MDPLGPFKQEAADLLAIVLSKKDIDIEPAFEDAPGGFGDVAFPCFGLAKVMRKAPKMIADELAVECTEVLQSVNGQLDNEPLIASVQAVNGYLNFSFNERMLINSTLSSIAREPETYGKGEDRDESVILEHTSANPNGPFHVGRARNPIIGDTLGRILSCAGYDVTTEYYVNDMGKQAVTLAWGVENLHIERNGSIADGSESISEGDTSTTKGNSRIAGGKEDPGDKLTPTWTNFGIKADHKLVSSYQRASKLMDEDPKVKEEINGMLEAYELGDREIGEKVQRYCSLVLDGMKHTLGKINVSLDSYAFESKFVYNGDVKRVIETLNTSKVSLEDDTAMYLELEGFGIHGRDTRFFYTRKGGTSLYTTRDLAYHTEKFSRGNRVIDVLGEDHKLQAQQLAIALGELGIERRPEAVFYAFVSLPEGKMSTRKNRVVYLDQLIEEALDMAFQEVSKKRPDLSEDERRKISELVGIGAIRYNIARVQMEKGITFKWEEALNFEGDSAPFIQYTHARACSILRKAGAEEEIGDTDGEQKGDTVGKENKNAGEEMGGAGHEIDPIDIDHLKILEGMTFTDPYEIALIRSLASFPGIVQECASGLKIHPMASYLRDCAQQFNQFYRECPVLKVEGMERESRVLLVRAFRTVIASGLDLLGIDAPEFM